MLNLLNLVEVADGPASKAVPKRLILTETHLLIQRQVTDPETDSIRPLRGSVSDSGEIEEDDEQPGEEKRTVQLNRKNSTLGISVRGGFEHSLPLIVSKIQPNSPAFESRQVYVGDAIIAINNRKLLKLTHTESMKILNGTESVTLTLKHFANTKQYLTSDDYENEKSIPLTFARLTRYLNKTDQLRVNSFELIDCSGNVSSGIIYVNSVQLSFWMKAIGEVINGLNAGELKSWLTPHLYCNWVSVGSTSSDPWLTWCPKILSITNTNLSLSDLPPHFCDASGPVLLHHTLLRVLSPSEILDERPHVFTIQIAQECTEWVGNKPESFYCGTETRMELERVEFAWLRAVRDSVKIVKTLLFPVWQHGKPCQLQLTLSEFKMLIPTLKKTLWSRPYSKLASSTDDSKTRLTLKFVDGTETMECRDLHRLLFSVHAFLLSGVKH